MLDFDQRRNFLKLASATLAAGITQTACSNQIQNPKLPPSEQRDLFVVDGIGALFDINNWANDAPYELVFPDAMVDDLMRSGLACIRHTTGIIDQPDEDAFQQAMAGVAWSHRWLYENDKSLTLIRTPEDIIEAKENKKIGITFTIQNCHAIGDDLSRVATFWGLGVQTFQLTYNAQNQFGGGSNAPEDLPLTKLGHDLISTLNEAGAIIDLSHSGRQTCLDAIKASSAPIIISHSGCRALNNIPRNKSDEEMRAIAESGGTFGIYFMPFLAKDGQATSNHLIAHIEHALNICGEDHVSIGTDGTYRTIEDMSKVRAKFKQFTEARIEAGNAAQGEFLDNINLLPDIAGANQFYQLAEKLASRNHPQNRIEKILGKNELRLMTEIWPGRDIPKN